MISTKKINKFEKIIGYSFKDKKLLLNSLVHPSSQIENKKNKFYSTNDFERLEFLGDRVLGLAISSLIFKKFNKNNEGDLSKKLSYLVQKNFLHKISEDLKIDTILQYSFKKNEKMNVSILADSIESLIGAIYLDGGFKNAKKFISKGDKVKFTIRFKGREFEHHDIAENLMERIRETMGTTSKIEQEPKLEGRQFTMIFTAN